jgi:hypothetical protein
MKRFKNLALAMLSLAAILSFASCEKDDDVPAPAPPSIVGLWKGKYGAVSDYPTLGYTMLFRSNGTVRVFDGTDTTIASKAEGTYSISGTTVTTNYTYLSSPNTYSTSATFNSIYTFMEGTYGAGAATSGAGQFFLVKQ